MYLSHMASFFNKLSGENEESRAVQRLLMEEFVIRLIAYFNKAVHLPLKQGILLAVA